MAFKLVIARWQRASFRRCLSPESSLKLTTYNLQLKTYDLQLTAYSLKLTTYNLQLIPAATGHAARRWRRSPLPASLRYLHSGID